jgi:uncharacterized membrane protein
MTRRLDSLDPGRGIWLDLAWRAVQVFVANMLVALAAADLWAALQRVQFWQDCAASAIAAVIAQVLALAASRAGVPRREPPPPRQDQPSGALADKPL